MLLVIAFAGFSIANERFFTWQNIENIIKQSSYMGIIAVGMTFVLLAGGIDLSVGSTMFIAGVVSGKLILDMDCPIWLAILAAVAAGGVIGAINAVCIAELKMLPFLVTLSTMFAARGLGAYITKSNLINYPREFTHLGSVRLLNIPVPVWIFIAVFVISLIILKFTPFGRQIYAIGNNADNARKAGIPSKKILLAIYIISGFLAAVGGVVSTIQIGQINTSFAEGYEFDAITAVVLGGTSLAGGIGDLFPGTLVGILLIFVIQAGLVYMQVNIYLQPIITALILLIAVFIDTVRSGYIKRLGHRNIMEIK